MSSNSATSLNNYNPVIFNKICIKDIIHPVNFELRADKMMKNIENISRRIQRLAVKEIPFMDFNKPIIIKEKEEEFLSKLNEEGKKNFIIKKKLFELFSPFEKEEKILAEIFALPNLSSNINCINRNKPISKQIDKHKIKKLTLYLNKNETEKAPQAQGKEFMFTKSGDKLSGRNVLPKDSQVKDDWLLCSHNSFLNSNFKDSSKSKIFQSRTNQIRTNKMGDSNSTSFKVILSQMVIPNLKNFNIVKNKQKKEEAVKLSDLNNHKTGSVTNSISENNNGNSNKYSDIPDNFNSSNSTGFNFNNNREELLSSRNSQSQSKSIKIKIIHKKTKSCQLAKDNGNASRERFIVNNLNEKENDAITKDNLTANKPFSISQTFLSDHSKKLTNARKDVYKYLIHKNFGLKYDLGFFNKTVISNKFQKKNKKTFPKLN